MMLLPELLLFCPAPAGLTGAHPAAQSVHLSLTALSHILYMQHNMLPSLHYSLVGDMIYFTVGTYVYKMVTLGHYTNTHLHILLHIGLNRILTVVATL